MRLYYFGKVTSETSQKLLLEIERVCGNNVEIYQAVRDLVERLRQIGTTPDAFVLSPTTKEELLELVDQKELFIDRPVILVLPDRNQSTIHNGHLLMPKFLLFNDNNLTDVAGVLEKMQASNFNKPSWSAFNNGISPSA